MPTTAHRVVYVMSRFPHLPETFITREMTALAALGVEIDLMPLMAQDQDVVHDEAKEWAARMRPLGIGSRPAWAAWRDLVRHRPRLAARLTAQIVRGYAHRPAELGRALAVLPSGALLARRCAEEGIPHIHAHYATYPALAAWIAHEISGVHYTVTVHAHDIYTTHAMLKEKVSGAEFVVAISEFNHRYLIDVLGPTVEDRIRVVHCGIRDHEYSAAATNRSRRDPRTPARLLCIASLQEYKGQRHLVDALALLRSRGVDAHLDLIGEGPDRDQLESRVASLGLADTVTLAGGKDQDAVRQALAAADCYVQPSVVSRTGQMEGIPVALMEAMAAGVPVVASDLSGIPELVRGEESGEPTGILVPPGDPDELADAIAAVLSEEAVSAQRARTGAELVRREFSLDATASTLNELFATVGEPSKEQMQ